MAWQTRKSSTVPVGPKLQCVFSWQINRIEQANAYNVHIAQEQVEVTEQNGENRN